jgi:hypothetical protein
MIVTYLDQRRPAVPRQIFRIIERNHVVGPAMQDHSVGLHRPDHPILLPCRAKQHELRITTDDVHGDGPTPARPNDNLRVVDVELGLGDSDGLGEVVVGQLRVENFVAVVFQLRRLHAARNRVPAVKEENLHDAGGSLGLRQFGQYQGAGVKTGLGLRLRHLAQRKRLPRGAVFGRTRLPDVSFFSPIQDSAKCLGLYGYWDVTGGRSSCYSAAKR